MARVIFVEGTKKQRGLERWVWVFVTITVVIAFGVFIYRPDYLLVPPFWH